MLAGIAHGISECLVQQKNRIEGITAPPITDAYFPSATLFAATPRFDAAAAAYADACATLAARCQHMLI